MMNREFATHNH